MPETLPAVVLDFDGVVLDSVDIKTRSFAALFEAEGPAVVARVVEHHLANGGLSRFEKFRWIYREVLKRPLAAERERELGDRFNALVEEAVLKAPFIEGAREFLEAQHRTRPLFVASGTPEGELRRIVERRGLSSFFRGVYGSPRRKDVILRQIASDLGAPVSSLTMVGDAINDHDAAAAAGCRFVGVCAPGAAHGFPAGATVIPDLRELPRALQEAAA